MDDHIVAELFQTKTDPQFTNSNFLRRQTTAITKSSDKKSLERPERLSIDYKAPEVPEFQKISPKPKGTNLKDAFAELFQKNKNLAACQKQNLVDKQAILDSKDKASDKWVESPPRHKSPRSNPKIDQVQLK